MMFSAVRRFAALAFVALAATACDTPPIRAFPDVTFADQTPIRLDVAQVEVVQSYQPTMEPPQVEHLFPQTPSEAMRRWVEERLQPVGTSGVARVYIENASVRSEALARTPGFRGTFTIDQSERLTADLAMRLEIQKPGGSGYAVASAQRSITVPENATLAEREDIWFRLTESTMNDLDTRMELSIRTNLVRFVGG
ncbi:MAG TPA: hypothetical protein VFO41_04450 [Alphaproteobacteria bacterium]|nr:hypothetical protein [Alphaproteobacteria bacterium]